MTVESAVRTLAPEARPDHVTDRREVTVDIQPSAGWAALNLADLWAYRELLYFLTWRDIKVRYKQTLMGISWVIIQPLLTMLIFTLVFTRFVKLEESAVPYPLF